MFDINKSDLIWDTDEDGDFLVDSDGEVYRIEISKIKVLKYITKAILPDGTYIEIESSDSGINSAIEIHDKINIMIENVLATRNKKTEKELQRKKDRDLFLEKELNPVVENLIKIKYEIGINSEEFVSALTSAVYENEVIIRILFKSLFSDLLPSDFIKEHPEEDPDYRWWEYY